MTSDWSSLAASLAESLRLGAPPLAITFTDAPPDGVPAFDEPMSAPTDDGRRGRVPAGCVFWMKGVDRTFSTVADDHGNCSVGSVTHGFKTLEEVGDKSDVATLLDSGWVTMDMVPEIPVVTEKPGAVVYGPLAETPVDPDVVLLRVNGKQLMTVSDAWPGLRIEGKPQCHIIAIAKEHGEPAASVGCALSRVRTGMNVTEMTMAIPARRLAEFVGSLKRTATVDNVVARYAADDAARFS
jgi:uncharacterized protein (DUF169 family)